MIDVGGFLAQSGLDAVVREAQKDSRLAATASAVVSNYFLPFLQLPGIAQLTDLVVGRLMGGRAAKRAGRALQDASADLSARTVWIHGRVVAGDLPIGSQLRPVAHDAKLQLFPGVRIPYPMILRVQVPEPPWEWRTADDFWKQLSRGYRIPGVSPQATPAFTRGQPVTYSGAYGGTTGTRAGRR